MTVHGPIVREVVQNRHARSVLRNKPPFQALRLRRLDILDTVERQTPLPFVKICSITRRSRAFLWLRWTRPLPMGASTVKGVSTRCGGGVDRSVAQRLERGLCTETFDATSYRQTHFSSSGQPFSFSLFPFPMSASSVGPSCGRAVPSLSARRRIVPTHLPAPLPCFCLCRPRRASRCAAAPSRLAAATAEAPAASASATADAVSSTLESRLQALVGTCPRFSAAADVRLRVRALEKELVAQNKVCAMIPCFQLSMTCRWHKLTRACLPSRFQGAGCCSVVRGRAARLLALHRGGRPRHTVVRLLWILHRG